jgi:hypothetical protein
MDRLEMGSPISLDDFRDLVGKKNKDSCLLIPPLVLIHIFKAPSGRAFPEDMVRLTKVKLTTGLIPKSGTQGSQVSESEEHLGQAGHQG